MDNNPGDKTDVAASDEIKDETFSTTDSWVIFIVIYVVSLILCFLYLFFRIDVKQFSISIFLLCLIFSSLFVMLNIMIMFDMSFNKMVGMEKFIEFVSIFYKVFNRVDKILGYVVFNLLIAILESGYYPMWKKFFDYWIKIWKIIPKKIIEIIIRLIFAIGILVILIIFREHFNLGKIPVDYFSIILDVFGMLEIYTNVGFFMLQLILDYKRKKEQRKIERYDRYSKIKIIEKTEKYMKKIKDSYNELKKDANIFEKNDKPDYHKYLQKVYNEMKAKVIEYELFEEENNLDSNNDNYPNNNNTNDNNNNKINYYNDNNINIDKYNKNTVRVSLSQGDSPNNRDQLEINGIDNINDKIKKEDFDTSKNIRKFKKAVIKINKLKKLYDVIDKETNEDRFKNNKKCFCTCGFVILFFVLV